MGDDDSDVSTSTTAIDLKGLEKVGKRECRVCGGTISLSTDQNYTTLLYYYFNAIVEALVL